MIKTYFIRNTISKLLIYSVHNLGSLERASDENQMSLEVKGVLEVTWPSPLILQLKKLKREEVKELTQGYTANYWQSEKPIGLYFILNSDPDDLSDMNQIPNFLEL